MRSERDIFRLARILVRSFREQLTTEEQAELDNWLQEDEAHQQAYKRYADEKFLQEKLNEAQQIDWQQDYQKFIRQNPARRVRSVGRWMRYAAILLLPLCVAWGYWFLTSPGLGERQPEVAAVSRNNVPVLTLAGGQRIVLEDSVRMNETDGTNVAGNQGTLLYQKTSLDSVSGTALIYNRLEIPRGAEYFLALADGTKIWLNSESEIRYPVNFSGSKREVYLVGEAFFQVAKDEKHPFIVHTGQTQIEVLGTAFNVRNYADESHIATTLVNGSVLLTDAEAGRKIILKPGEQGCVDKTTGLSDVRDVDTYLYTAWKDSRFVFRNTRMEDLLNTLVRWYDLTVFYQNTAVKDICFTGDMTRMGDFRQILDIIESNERVRFTVNDRTVIVSLK